MKLTFVRKDKDKAYVADRLWLPKSGVRVESVQNALNFKINTFGGQSNISLWSETAHHIICPREFIKAEDYKRYKFPFIDLRPKFNHVDFKCSVVPRDDEQRAAVKALEENDNGILNLACGKGKTKISLLKIAQKQTSTLIVVPDGGILSQWEEAILGNKSKGIKPSLTFKGQMGLIRGPIFDWARPITLALVTTLWQRIEQGSVPEEMFKYFGLVVWDEVHQIGAPKFSLTATPFYGDRIGLTATVSREDGLDPIYRYNIGEPFYSDLKQSLIPDTIIQQTPVTLDMSKAESANGIVNVSLLRALLGRDLTGNMFRYWKIMDAVKEGRKILCLSHSVDQLKLMQCLFPGSGLIIGDTPQNARMDILRNSKICFAIAKLGATGVDDDKLDTLFWITPFKSVNMLQQSMGRIQRASPDKKKPLMIVFDDWSVLTLRKLVMRIKFQLRKWKYPTVTRPPGGVIPEISDKALMKKYFLMLDSLSGIEEVVDDE